MTEMGLEVLVVGRGTGMEHYGFDTIRVKQKDFLPIMWAMIGFCFCFLLLRYWTRWKTFRCFSSDDLFALLAWLSAAAMGAVSIWMVDSMYWTMHLTLEPIDPTGFDPNLLNYVRKYAHGVNICYMLMCTSLWCVKLSFLLFFYRLGPRLITGMKWHWWGVTAFTMLAYCATFATYPYMCSFGTYEQIMQPYCTGEQTMSFVNMKVNVVLDVVTDILIMTIPLNILWRSQIPLRQSLALAGVFSLVLITITFAIVRAALSTIGVTKQMDSPWVLVWSGAETNIAIVVASIGSFRMLFVQHRREEGRQRDEAGRRRRVVIKSTTMEPGASVEEMASVGGTAEWSEMGTVESTLASTMHSTVHSNLASESTMSGSARA